MSVGVKWALSAQWEKGITVDVAKLSLSPRLANNGKMYNVTKAKKLILYNPYNQADLVLVRINALLFMLIVEKNIMQVKAFSDNELTDVGGNSKFQNCEVEKEEKNIKTAQKRSFALPVGSPRVKYLLGPGLKCKILFLMYFAAHSLVWS